MNYLLSAYAIILVIVGSYIIRVNKKCSACVDKIKKQGVTASTASIIDRKNVRFAMITLTTLLLIISAYMGLVWAPNAIGEPPTYRIIFFHVPVAITSYIGFFITFLGGILYLWKKELRFDRWARVGADLGVHFSMLMIISGMIWGKQRWGAWWVWEPRLTTALILLLTYTGYLILRHVLDDPDTRARYSSVYGIIAFANVFAVKYAIKMWGSLMHPVIQRSANKAGLSPDMKLTLYVAELTFFITFWVMYLIRLRVENLESDIARHRALSNETD